MFGVGWISGGGWGLSPPRPSVDFRAMSELALTAVRAALQHSADRAPVRSEESVFSVSKQNLGLGPAIGALFYPFFFGWEGSGGPARCPFLFPFFFLVGRIRDPTKIGYGGKN